MKYIKALLLTATASLALALSATTPATSPAPSQAKKAGKTISKTVTPSDRVISDRPKVPSKQRVSCSYDGEYLTFDFVIAEGECEVAIAEWYSAAVQTYTIDSTDLTAEIYVGELYESTITVTTERGNTYTADLTADEE